MASLTAMFDIRDRISNRVRQMRGNFRRLRDAVDQVQRRVESLSRTRAIIQARLRDAATRGLNRIRDLRDYLNRRVAVIRTVIRDRASRGLLKLRQLGDAIRRRAVIITTRVRDLATRALNKLAAQVPKISHMVAWVRTKVRDSASATLVQIKATLAYLKGRTVVVRTKIRDLASRGLSRIKSLGEALRRRAIIIGTKLRDLATRGLRRVKDLATTLAGYAATIRTKVRDMATRGLNKLKTLATKIGSLVPIIKTKVYDLATKALNKVKSLAQKVASATVTVVVKVKDLATRAISRIESAAAGIQNRMFSLGAAIGGTAILAQGANAFETDARASAISGISQPKVTSMTDQIYYGEKIGTERSGVAQSLVDFAQQTDLQGKALQQAAKTSAMFAQLYGKDIPETDRAFASAYKNQLGSMSEIGDVSAYVLKNAGDQYDDYLDTINEYGSTFKDLKLNMNQVGAAFVAAIQAGGRNFDEPADMFREFNIRRSEMTDSQITAMAKVLGKDRTRELYKAMDAGTLSGEQTMFEFATALAKIPSETQRALYATELLGTKYEDIKEPMLAAARAIHEPIEATGELEKQFASMRDNNPMTAINDAGRNLGKLLKDIGQSVLTAVTPAFIELNKWASSPEGQKAIANFTASVAKLSGQLANGLAKAIQWVINNWDTLLPILKTGVTVLGSLLIAGKVVKVFKFLQPVFNVLGKILPYVWKGFKLVWSALAWLGKGFLKVLNWAKPFLPWIGKVIGGLARFVPVVGWVITALGLLWAAWKNWNTISEVVSNAFGRAKNAVAEGVNWILRKVNWLIQKLNSFSVPIPEVLGGGSLGFDVPEIPLMETEASRNAQKIVSQAAHDAGLPNLLEGYTKSHAKGISDIPYDNYKANLHKGETVLPREEAELIRNMAASGGGSAPTAAAAAPISINFYGDNIYSDEMDAKKVVRVIKKALEDEHNLGPQGVQFV